MLIRGIGTTLPQGVRLADVLDGKVTSPAVREWATELMNYNLYARIKGRTNSGNRIGDLGRMAA